MKSFFSRLHDTQTGHSKSAATRESYKFWIPNADPDRESSKPTSGHENAVKASTSRPHAEKRSSSRAPKSSQPVPTPQYDRPFPATSAAISGQTTEYIRQNMVSPSNQYYSQPPTKVTSTRTRDYDDPRLQPPPRPPSRPSYPARPTIIHDNPTKSSRYGNVRSESTAPIQHQVWMPTIAPSVSRQPEEQKKSVQESDEAIERFRSRYDENDRPPESGRRDRDRLREKERERERPREREGDRDRTRYGGRDREQEKIRDDRERERGRVRDKDRERERGQEVEKEQEHIKERERDRERDRLERDKERERERERDRLERLERDKERERLEREREREKERERERDRRERERAARHAERDRREREREKEKARAREREWEQKVKERENEANRESPTAKGKERAREERPMIYDHAERPSDGTRIDAHIQDRDIRRDKEIRATRDSENHRARDRDRDQPKYRAEATDGEQELRKSKPRMSERDKRKDANQGWVSDNYIAHERRPSRTVNPESAPIEEAESSDGSLRPKQGIRMVPKRTRVEEAILSTKPPRSRQDRPPDFRSSLPPNIPQSVIHPISDAQAPVTSTPLNMPVHLPPKDTKTVEERPTQQVTNALPLTEPSDVPVRREINRLRLNEPPSHSNESTTRVTEQHSSSTNHRRPPSHISSTPYPSQPGYSYSSRNDHSMTLSRQFQPSASITQTNSNQQPELVKEVLPRSEWPRDQRLHSERPSEPTSHPRMEPSAPPLGRLGVDHSISNQPVAQEKSTVDSNAKQTPMIPSEGYSRSRLNSLSNKPQNVPSSSQVNILTPHPATITQDSRPIGYAGTGQISMVPSEGYVRSRLNSLSAKPEPFPVSNQNISIPVYLATVEQPSVLINQFSVSDQKETQLKAALESILSPEHTNGSKERLYNKRDISVDHVTIPNEHPQIFQTQTESSHPISKPQNSLQPVPIQPVQVLDTGMLYSGSSIQRPPSASGYRDDSHQYLRNLHSSVAMSTERPIIVQASTSSQTQKPPDTLSSNKHQHLSEAQVNENRVFSPYDFQNNVESQKPVPRVVPLDGPFRTQESNDQERVGLSISRPPTGLGHDGGRAIKHSGASIANPSAYPEVIRILPSLQPTEMVTGPPQVGPSLSGNATARIESSGLQVPSNVASHFTRTTSTNEQPIIKTYVREQESPKVLRHQRPSISQSEAYPAPFQEPDSFPVTHGTSRQGPFPAPAETRVDAPQSHTGARPSANPTYANRIAVSEVQSEAQSSGSGARFTNTGDIHDGARVVQNRPTPAIHPSLTQNPYPSPALAQTSSTYGQTVFKEDDSPSRRSQRHLGASLLQSSKVPKDDNTNVNVDAGSQTMKTATQQWGPWGYTQPIDKAELTDLRIEQYDVPSSTNDPMNSKRESPTTRNRHVTSTPKVETMGLQIPSPLNPNHESPRGVQPTINTPGFGQQSLPPANSEYIPQRQRRDSRQDSPRARVENQGSGSPNKKLSVPVTQTPLLSVKSPVEQSSVQPVSKEDQLAGFELSTDNIPRTGAVVIPSVVPQLRIPESTGNHWSKPPEGGMIGNSSQHGTTKTSVDHFVKPTEDGYPNSTSVPQLRIPKPIPPDGLKSDQGMHAVHSTARVAPPSLNVDNPLQVPPISSKISASVVNDSFPSLSENTRSQTPRVNNSHEAFLARRAELKGLNLQMGSTPKQPVQVLESTHIPATHHRTASGSKQNTVEATVDAEPVSLGFFSPDFSSALNASVGKRDAHMSKTVVANERVNSESRPGKTSHVESADYTIQTTNTTKILDSRLPTRDHRPDGEQREPSRFHRAPDSVRKDDEIEKASFPPRPPTAPFIHPGLAEILSSPPSTRPPPLARYQNAASSEHISGTDPRMGISVNSNTDVPKSYNPISERAQPVIESTRPPVSRRHGPFQATPGDALSESKENLVQDNRLFGSKVSNVMLASGTTGGRDSSVPGPLTLLPSSNPVAGPMTNFDGSMKEPLFHESRAHTSRPVNQPQVNQGGKDYLYSGPAFSSTRAMPTLTTTTGAHAPVQKQEPVSLADTNPTRGFVGRSGLDPMGYDKRGYFVPASAHTQQSNDNRGVISESHPSHRAYPPPTADYWPQAMSQVPQSPFSSTHPSSRHQHSSSLLVSFAPGQSAPQSLSKNEDSAPVNPRTSTHRTTIHYQTTFTPFQTNTFPVDVSAADASIASIPNAPSEETLLKTPSSLAHSMMLKPTASRQSETPSVASQNVKKGGLFKMFRRTSTPAPAPTPKYEVWHPTANATTPESSPGHGKTTRVAHETQAESSSPKKAPPAVEFAIPVPIHGQSEQRKASHAHVFSPFKYLTSKRIRTVSVASVEAQDGTAPNTVVGSPTASTHSQNLLLPPPVRDPLQATHEWRNKEEADAKVRAKAKLRRQPPGVVFDVGEEVPDDGPKRPRRTRTKYRSSTSTRQAAAEPAPQT